MLRDVYDKGSVVRVKTWEAQPVTHARELKIHFKILVIGQRECFSCMDVCIQCACSNSGSQKRASGPLGLELQVVVNHYVDTGT